jgi:hypothetical protein
MKRRAVYFTPLIPIAIFAIIATVLDPALTAAAGNAELTARIHADMILLGLVGMASAIISAYVAGEAL